MPNYQVLFKVGDSHSGKWHDGMVIEVIPSSWCAWWSPAEIQAHLSTGAVPATWGPLPQEIKDHVNRMVEAAKAGELNKYGMPALWLAHGFHTIWGVKDLMHGLAVEIEDMTPAQAQTIKELAGPVPDPGVPEPSGVPSKVRDYILEFWNHVSPALQARIRDRNEYVKPITGQGITFASLKELVT